MDALEQLVCLDQVGQLELLETAEDLVHVVELAYGESLVKEVSQEQREPLVQLVQLVTLEQLEPLVLPEEQVLLVTLDVTVLRVLAEVLEDQELAS